MEDSNYFNQKLNLLVKAIEVTTKNEDNLNVNINDCDSSSSIDDNNSNISCNSHSHSISSETKSTSSSSICNEQQQQHHTQKVSSHSPLTIKTPQQLSNLDIVKNFLSQSTTSINSNEASSSNTQATTITASKLLSSCFPLFIGKNGKPTRPFKAYPKEPLSIPLGGCTSGLNMNLLTDETSTNGTTASFHLSTDTTTDNILAALSSTTDLTALALNTSDFCSQYRKRIEQAKSRLEIKNKLKRKNISSMFTSKKVHIENHKSPEAQNEQNTQLVHVVEENCKANDVIDKSVIVTNTLTYQNNGLIPPPKKRHRVHLQQLEELELQQKNLRLQLEKQQHEQQEQDQKEKLLLASISKTTQQPTLTSPLTLTTTTPPSSSNSSPISTSTNLCYSASGVCSGSSSISSGSSPNESCLSSSSSLCATSSQLLLLSQDDAYKERRRKNNEAAKRSRDARRAKEDEIALRAALLERENLQLKVELAQLKQETSKLRCLLYNS